MQELDNPAIPSFLRLARLLDLGLFADTPSGEFKALVPRSDQLWEELFVSAQDNRALAPLCYIFAAKPAFGALAGDDEISAMQEWHRRTGGFIQTTRSAVHVAERVISPVR